MEQGEAILIRRTVWSDTSFLTTWLLPDLGKVRAMAKAARRPGSPFAGKLDLFFHAEIGFARGKGSPPLHQLREVKVLTAFNATHVPCANVYACGYFAELVDLCTEPAEPAPEIFDLLLRAIRHLSEKPVTLRAIEHFEAQLCRAIGIHEDGHHPLAALERYGGKVPASRLTALKLLGLK